MFQLLEQRNLSDSCAGNALLLALQSDLLHGHNLPRSLVLTFIHNPICTWGKARALDETMYWQLLFMLPNCWTSLLVTKVILVKRRTTL